MQPNYLGAALACALVVAPTLPASAQNANQCAVIVADLDRLACYDALFRPATDTGNGLSITFQSEQLIPARPSGRAPATMTVTCDAGNLTVEFAYAGNTMSALGRDAGMTLQYDLQAARSRTLPVNSNNTAILIDNTAESLAFLDSLAGANNLTTKVTPVNSRSLSVRFSLDGVLDAIAPVRASCS